MFRVDKMLSEIDRLVPTSANWKTKATNSLSNFHCKTFPNEYIPMIKLKLIFHQGIPYA